MNNRDERRRQLLDVAAAIVVTRGPAAMTCDAVARRCRVSTSLVWKYFGNREGLLAALADDARRRRDLRLRQALERITA